MSTILEHIAILRKLRGGGALERSVREQQAYQSAAYLLVDAHLEEIAALAEPSPNAVNQQLVEALREARGWFSESGPLARKMDAALAAAEGAKT